VVDGNKNVTDYEVFDVSFWEWPCENAAEG
jgi:hypothetical protein